MQASKFMCFNFLCLLSVCAVTRAEEDSPECQESSLLQAGVYLQKEKSSSSYASPLLRGDTGASNFSSFNCNTDYLLIYSRPKTATTSMMYSFLNLCGLSSEPKYWGGVDKQETYSRLFKVHDHDVASDYLSKVPKESRLWLFTMVRNPFSRAASFFFEGMSQGQGSTSQLLDQGVDDVAQYVDYFHSIDMLGAWYQEQESEFISGLEKMAGIQLPGKAFDHSRSRLFTSSVKDTKETLVVLLRLDDAAQWTDVIADYAPGFVLAEENEAEDKSSLYTDMYEQFKNHFVYSESEKAKLLVSDVFQYYNSSELASVTTGQMVGFPR